MIYTVFFTSLAILFFGCYLDYFLENGTEDTVTLVCTVVCVVSGISAFTLLLYNATQ
ncbi:hypothetical protein MACA111363_11250 [Macrococcoides canis]|uniref:Uncharacterized protein n=1 Tax=Macrococcoides canis TaxID=1855823 RepID=A0A1W7ACJ7_9STAP|nr:hypothetical protein MCCS_16750 [Macrococcus canis]